MPTTCRCACTALDGFVRVARHLNLNVQLEILIGMYQLIDAIGFSLNMKFLPLYLDIMRLPDRGAQLVEVVPSLTSLQDHIRLLTSTLFPLSAIAVLMVVPG